MVCEIEGEYRVPEVPVYNKRIQEIGRKHRILMPKMYLGPASSSEVKEIEKKLTDYNKDLEHKLTCMKSGHSIIHVRECIRRQTKELQEYIPCILTHELLPCLKRFLGTFGSACSYVKLIFHHVLAKLNHEARAYFEGSDDGFHLKCYFDLYYGGTNPKVSFDLINEVWKHHPSIEFKLRLLCCKRLFENKQYDILNHLIQNNDEYFVIVQKNIRPDQRCLDLEEYFIVLIILLCHYVTSRQTANIETVLMLVENVPPDLKLTHWNMLLTIRLQQTRLIPLLIKVLLNRPEFQYVSLEILSILNTMDVEEKMLKMSNLRSFLLMLILLMISSDSQHKSAKLKKYLALKYEYEDAILYLLWCSGDVEINPGPTLKRLKKTSDSVKKRNWIHDMCTTTLKILKSIELDSKSDGMWKEKPDIWKKLPGDKPFYDPRNKPKDKKYNIKTDEELLNCLLRCCAHPEKNITLPSNFQKEITAWKNDKVLLLELWIARQEIEAMRMAMGLLVTYSETPDLKRILKDCNVDLSFNSNSSQEKGPKAYSDIVRDLATTFCRISKDLPILEKKDGIWKTPPDDWNCWNTKDAYKDPCNTSKRHEKFQDQKLVNYLLDYCEKKEIPIPSELQLVVEAWKLGNRNDICKHYTIWSSMEIIQHSIKYLELEGLLEKPHVQKSLKQIGVSPHCEKPDFQNHPSTSGCTIHSTLVPCPDSRGDLQYTDERLDIPDSHKCVSEISCQEPIFQPSSSGCSSITQRAECRKDSDDLPSTDGRVQKRKRAISEERLDKRSALQPGNESQASTSSINRCNGVTTPSSHCDVDNADQNLHKTDTEEDLEQDHSSDRIPVQDNIQDTDSSNDQLFGSEDEIPNHLHPYINDYLSCDTSNLEDNLIDNLIEDIDIEWWETLQMQ